MSRVSEAAALSLLMLFGCERRATPEPRAGAAPRLSRGDVTAYELGRRREIELTRAALELVQHTGSAAQHSVMEAAADPDHMTVDAARVSGLRVEEYRSMVSRVDSALVLDSSLSTDASARRLDSLRVALVVLRSRLSAEVSQPFVAKPVTRSRP